MQLMLFRPLETVKRSFFAGRKEESRWHERFRHVNFDFMEKSVKENAIFLGHGDVLEDAYKCDICVMTWKLKPQ